MNVVAACKESKPERAATILTPHEGRWRGSFWKRGVCDVSSIMGGVSIPYWRGGHFQTRVSVLEVGCRFCDSALRGIGRWVGGC